MSDHKMGQHNVDRYQRAIQLRSDGLTFDAVGKSLGVTRERARQMVKKAIRLGLQPSPLDADDKSRYR